MKKMLASLRKREQRRLRDPLPETLLAKYLRLRPKTSSIQRNSKIIAASAALAIIAAASTAANAQTAAPNVQPIAPAPPEPRSVPSGCRRLIHLHPALLHHLGNLVRQGHLAAFLEQISECHPSGAGNREFALLPTADGAVAGD